MPLRGTGPALGTSAATSAVAEAVDAGGDHVSLATEEWCGGAGACSASELLPLLGAGVMPACRGVAARGRAWTAEDLRSWKPRVKWERLVGMREKAT